MPIVAIAPALGLLATSAITATGTFIRCYVVSNTCGRSVTYDGNLATEDLTSSVIPALKETVQLRAQNEGLLSTASNTGYCGVPQYNFDMCSNDLNHVVIHTSLPAAGAVRFDNVPPTCMVLANVLTGGCGLAPPHPTVCGSACLQYTGLTEAQLHQMADAMRSKVVLG